MFEAFTKKQIIGGAIAIVIVVVLVIVGLFSKSSIKLNYEIDISDVNTNVDMINTVRNEGIQCGTVSIKLGQEIDIAPYTIEEEAVVKGTEIKKLLAPSKKYELVVIGYTNSYRVYEIRTTVPTVYSTRGFTIGDNVSDVKKTVKIANKKKAVYKDKDFIMNMEFISGILVVLDLKCA